MTISEKTYYIFPEEEDHFGVKAIINVCKSIDILTKNAYSAATLKNYYEKVNSKEFSKDELSEIFNYIVRALHYLSALNALSSINSGYRDISRVSIVTWYYATYFAAIAALKATDKNYTPDNHMKTFKYWEGHINRKGLVLPPFSIRLSSLLDTDYKTELKKNPKYSAKIIPNQTNPKNVDEAESVYLSYLKTTADHFSEITKNQIKKDKKLQNFKSKKAREIRDKTLRKKSCGYLHFAYRLRTKANYRESNSFIYPSFSSLSENLSSMLYAPAKLFFITNCYYCYKKVGEKQYNSFLEELKDLTRIREDINIIDFKK